jgi:hypothetical protein
MRRAVRCVSQPAVGVHQDAETRLDRLAGTGDDMSGSVDNLLRVWDQADFTDYAEGMLAYGRYRHTLNRLAKHYGYPLESVVGAFAALSPNLDYLNNLRSTVSLLRGSERTAGYGACRDRAQRALRGEHFLAFTRGPKTRAFFSNIMDPSDPGPVTVDGHAYCAYVGQRMTMREVVYLRMNYDGVADAYREAAGRVNVLPCQFQAVLWFAWKRINNIIFKPQMHLFRQHDQWGLDLRPSDIRDFHSAQSLFS